MRYHIMMFKLLLTLLAISMAFFTACSTQSPSQSNPVGADFLAVITNGENNNGAILDEEDEGDPGSGLMYKLDPPFSFSYGAKQQNFIMTVGTDTGPHSMYTGNYIIIESVIVPANGNTANHTFSANYNSIPGWPPTVIHEWRAEDTSGNIVSGTGSPFIYTTTGTGEHRVDYKAKHATTGETLAHYVGLMDVQ